MDNVDPGIIAEVVQKFSPYIKFLSKNYYIVGGTDDDLFQEGVIGLIQACKNYSGDSLLDDKFAPFARLCIKRQILDAIKKSNAQKNKVLNESVSFNSYYENGDDRTMLDIVVDRNFSNDPLDIFLDKEKIEEKLRICEKELSDFEKEILTHYLSGEKQSEIAVSMKIDSKIVDNTLQKIKSKLNKLN